MVWLQLSICLLKIVLIDFVSRWAIERNQRSKVDGDRHNRGHSKHSRIGHHTRKRPLKRRLLKGGFNYVLVGLRTLSRHKYARRNYK